MLALRLRCRFWITAWWLRRHALPAVLIPVAMASIVLTGVLVLPGGPDTGCHAVTGTGRAHFLCRPGHPPGP